MYSRRAAYNRPRSVKMQLVFSCNYIRGEDDKLYCKELAAALVTNTGVEAVAHYIFAGPSPYNMLNEGQKNYNAMLARNVHGLRYNEGFIDYKKFVPIVRGLCERATGLFAYGQDCTFLEAATGLSFTCLAKNLNAPNPTAIAVQGLSCLAPCHRVIRSFQCALTNAHVLAQWLHSHQTKLLSERLCSIPSQNETECDVSRVDMCG